MDPEAVPNTVKLPQEEMQVVVMLGPEESVDLKLFPILYDSFDQE